ncbi:hypothetical protein IWX83_003300 [Flavobacterium sp. CG_9.1]|uniref:hypothetical protein n=1 Tax=Flavobacterium sp. CG_9.1 TaxID=2787728 RepID=UPI0018CB8096|nr:hypothetical protein [Flavobacterium sp. CG_9.1]MBG6063490.1 hypothetical protein [Flavobacterium sp. CG_9.1]
MKKLLFIAAVLLISVNGFANAKEEITKENPKVNDVSSCCTATLTYNGIYVDHREVCGMITTGDNCNVAKEQLLAAHPEVPRITAE